MVSVVLVVVVVVCAGVGGDGGGGGGGRRVGGVDGCGVGVGDVGGALSLMLLIKLVMTTVVLGLSEVLVLVSVWVALLCGVFVATLVGSGSL